MQYINVQIDYKIIMCIKKLSGKLLVEETKVSSDRGKL